MNKIEQALEKAQEIKSTVIEISTNALDIGLRAILPDFIEDDIIDIKNKFIEEGFKEGIQEIIDKLEETGKSIKGLFTGEFESVTDILKLIKSDGLLDGISELIDKILKTLKDKKIIDSTTYNLIKSGKKTILSTIEDDLEDLYKESTYSMEKLSEYCEEWKQYYEAEDYEGMTNAMKKINQRLKQSTLVENTINEARNIEKIQEYINEKGTIENLSEEEKELLEKIN